MINKIAEIRQMKKLSQDKLAQKANITRPYLSDLENNKKKPSYEVANRIAKALEKPMEEIFFDDNVNYNIQNQSA